LRRNQTDAEELLWKKLRGRRFKGIKFLRQHPIIFEYYRKKRFVVADFYCHKSKLIIELDGGIHEKQKDYDDARDYVIKSLGLRVLRFTNEKVFRDTREVLEDIEKHLD
jgi:very-short-patch-repair endonuclease